MADTEQSSIDGVNERVRPDTSSQSPGERQNHLEAWALDLATHLFYSTSPYLRFSSLNRRISDACIRMSGVTFVTLVYSMQVKKAGPRGGR